MTHSDETFRLTPQRRTILEEMRKVRRHPTADEIHDMVRCRLPNISLGTVYRNLEIMTRMGILRKLEICGRQKRFDATTALHPHMRCVECGEIEDALIDPAEVRRLIGALSNAKRFEVIEARIEFSGYCSRCAKEKR